MTRIHHSIAPLLCGAIALGLAAGAVQAAEKKAFARTTPPTPAVAAPPAPALATPRLPAAEAEALGHPRGPDADKYEAALKKWAGLAARGDAAAQLKLGRSYRRAGNSRTNAEQALHWLSAAARANLPAAHYQLGLLHMSGAKGRAPDLVEAYARFKIASDGGDVRAAALIFYIGVRMTAPELRRAHERIAEIHQFETAPLTPATRAVTVQTETVPTDAAKTEATAKPAAGLPAK